MGVIDPAPTRRGVPKVFVPKKDGTISLGMVYRKLKAVVIWDLYQISCNEKCIEMFGKAAIFSPMDASRRYWHVGIAKDARGKTAFVTHYGLSLYSRMLSGLKKAPQMF